MLIKTYNFKTIYGHHIYEDFLISKQSADIVIKIMERKHLTSHNQNNTKLLKYQCIPLEKYRLIKT